MKKILSLKTATIGISIILSFIILFHILVIVKVIPFNILRGGNINDESTFLRMELISIAINSIMLLFVFTYLGVTKISLNPAIFKIGFWAMLVIFILNTLGNILAKNSLETYIFTPLTLLLSLFCLRIATHSSSKRSSMSNH